MKSVKAGSKNNNSSSSSSSRSMKSKKIGILDDINTIALNESIRKNENESGIKFTQEEKNKMHQLADGNLNLVEITIPHFEIKIKDYIENIEKINKNLETLEKILKLERKLTKKEIDKLNDLNMQCIELIDYEKKQHISHTIDLNFLEGHSQKEEFEDLFETYKTKYLEMIKKLNDFIKIYGHHSQAINEGYSSNEHKLKVESVLADLYAEELLNEEENNKYNKSKKNPKSKKKNRKGGTKKKKIKKGK